MIPRGDQRIGPYLSDTVVQGDPELVYRARDSQDLTEILKYCHQEKIPVTFCGSQTSLTGSSVAFGGLLVWMGHRDRVLDIEKNQATAESGILLGQFQRQIEEAGCFYPPDPTSRHEAQLGGTVGTNAAGEDCLLYGSTRDYVRRLKLFKADGTEIVIERKLPFNGPHKGRGGYCLDGDPIDLFIGSEGTLGVVTEVTVDLLPPSNPFFLAWAFFPDFESALEFVITARRDQQVRPRSMELLDEESLKIVASQERPPTGALRGKAAVTFKQEYANEAEGDLYLGRWLGLIEPLLKSKEVSGFLDYIVVADDPVSKERLRKLRHAVPSTVNEEVSRYRIDGGGKISTDWWVPVEKIREMMDEVKRESEELGLRYLAYAHFGEGHPHINYVARNHSEMARAQKLLLHQCRRAVKLGGGVAGEHGLGKLYRHLLKVQWPSSVIRQMKQIKKEFDPNNILGKGNIF
ncbi:MAG: FAD-binding oxidoreductase [Deltaproteobacteria bacterium]|nr:FAD-binding oxidoreductase [Deltaproteobacteria bacterium]